MIAGELYYLSAPISATWVNNSELVIEAAILDVGNLLESHELVNHLKNLQKSFIGSRNE
jgi:hypothetical protein